MTYYHVLVELQDTPKEVRCIFSDLILKELESKFLKPYRHGQRMFVGTEVINTMAITSARIIETSRVSDAELHEIQQKSRREIDDFNSSSSSVVLISVGRGYELEDIEEAGTDVTACFIDSPPGQGRNSEPEAVVDHLGLDICAQSREVEVMKTLNIVVFVMGSVAGAGIAAYYLQRTEPPSGARETSTALESLPGQENSSTSSLRTPGDGAIPQDKAEVVVSDNVDASIVAIPLPPEFDRVFLKSIDTRKMRRMLERQPRDPIWATAMEEAHRNYILSKPELLAFGIFPEVECRSSVCEARMLARGGDETKEWLKFLEKPGSVPWPEGGVPLVIASDQHSGTTAIMIHTAFQNRPYTPLQQRR